MDFEIFDGVRHFLGYRNNGFELAEISVFRAIGHHLAVVAGFPGVVYCFLGRFGIFVVCVGRVGLGCRHGFDSVRRYVAVQSRRAEPL